jgi:hypothetical protein
VSFNSHTYHANKYARQAWEQISAARVLRDMDGRPESIESCVKLARCYMRLSLSNRRLRQLERSSR